MKEDSLIVPDPDKVMRYGVRGFIIAVGTTLNGSILFAIVMGIASLEYKSASYEQIHVRIFEISGLILIATTILVCATHAPERRLCYYFMILPSFIFVLGMLSSARA